VWCVVYVLYLIVVLLPAGKISFVVKINNNNNSSKPNDIFIRVCTISGKGLQPNSLIKNWVTVPRKHKMSSLSGPVS
jgi:hypothetical protein